MKTIPLLTLLFLFTQVSSIRAQWVQTNGPNEPYITHLLAIPNAIGGTNLFASTRGGSLSPDSVGGVFLSTNNGASWTSVNTGITRRYILSLAASETTLFLGTLGARHGLYRSSNKGTTWTISDSGLSGGNVWAIAATQDSIGKTTLLAATDFDVCRSTNNGTNWTQGSPGLTEPYQGGYFPPVNDFAVSGTNVFAATQDGVYLSTNNGASWTFRDSMMTYNQVYTIVVSRDGSTVFAGTNGNGMFRSTNNGTSWSVIDSGMPKSYYAVTSFSFSDTNLFAGTTAGVFLSTDKGTSWEAVNDGFTNNYASSIVVCGTNLFAASGSNVWRRPLSEMITSVASHPVNLLTHFSLSQNYPNPFNPTTMISFFLPIRSFTSLKVFDILGREVSTLVSGELMAGPHTQQWNAEHMSSGLYFYRLQAGSFSATKKLLLLK